MFRNLPRYEAYHDPIDWLDQIPAHWSRRRFGTLLREKDIRSQTGEEQLLRVSQYTGVTERRTESGEGIDSRSDSLVGYKIVSHGQLAVNIMLAWNGSLGVSSYNGIVSPAYCVYSFRAGFEPWFFHYLLRIQQYKARIKASSRGIVDSRLRLYSEDLYRLEAVVPPEDEQKAIVKYLAHANARIDKAIAAKRSLIDLLAERKRVEVSTLISSGDAITGDQWFPVVRNGWSVVSLGRVLHRAVDGPHFSPTYSDSGVPFLSARNIRPGAWSFDDLKYVNEGLATEFDRRVRPEIGDVLYTKGGTTGVAKAVDVDERFQVWVHIAVLKLIKDLVTPEFLEIVLNSPACYEQSQLETRGATNQDLGLGRMKRISIPLAPPEAQASFVRQVRIAAQKIKSVAQQTQREIELLQEFRTRLVADVVTGQVDVRAIAATLPEAPESVDNLITAVDDDFEEALSEGEG